MTKIVCCESWDKATRRRLSHYSVRPVRVEHLSINHFDDSVSEKNRNVVTYFHYENKKFR